MPSTFRVSQVDAAWWVVGEESVRTHQEEGERCKPSVPEKRLTNSKGLRVRSNDQATRQSRFSCAIAPSQGGWCAWWSSRPEVGSAAFARAALTLVVLGMAVACANPPSDDALLELFKTRQARLEALLKEVLENPRMGDLEKAHATQDGLAEYGITSDEAADYQEFLREAGVRAVRNIRRYSDAEPVYFVVYKYYIYHDGISKGFAWSDGSPVPTVSSLDGRARGAGKAFRHVAGNWYLFFAPV